MYTALFYEDFFMKTKVLLFALSLILLIFLFIPLYTPYNKNNAYSIPTIKSKGILKETVNISADKAILIEKETGIILYNKNSDSKAGMASTTKIMTCILAIEQMDIYSLVTIPKDAVGIEGSSLYLREGEIFTLYDLLVGLMLESGNDVAVAIALSCCQTVEEFSCLMNNKAKELGMKNTHFSNPHGLSHSEHYSTPRDMATLSRYALQNDTFKEIVGLKKYTITPKNSEYIRYCYNHNKLLFNYEGTTGIKTGYTKLDGRCLVSSVERNGIELICVTLNGVDHWNDHKNLYAESFKKLEKRTLSAKGENAFEISVVGGKSNFATAINNTAIELYLPIDADIETKVYLPQFIYAPISKGEIIGELRIYCNNEIIHTVPLCSIENIEVKKISFFKKIFG